MFVETWMAGGLGRAQGAYDEMVFRSMVRDGSRFYDPLGLVSEGVKIDFQIEVNSYLYGTRFLSYLAYERSPEQVIEWARRGEGTKAYYASQFRKVFGRSLDDAWQRLDLVGARLPAEEPRLGAPVPAHAVSRTSRPRALGSVSRAYFDAQKQALYAGLNYPGIVSHLGAISLADGPVRKLADVKGPRSTPSPRSPGTPARARSSTPPTTTQLRDLLSLSPDTGKPRLLLKDARIGDLVYSAAEQALWGVRT